MKMLYTSLYHRHPLVTSIHLPQSIEDAHARFELHYRRLLIFKNSNYNGSRKTGAHVVE